MVNPVAPAEITRTCPACNRPVKPGFKFCEFCGTRIPELSTCSKCGTQFIAPVKFCDLCGAPVVLEVLTEADELPEHAVEEDTGPVDDEEPEHDEEEISEPDTGELPEESGEGTAGPVDDETLAYHKDKIQEPDTDELLEKYGREYSDDETLESSHKPKLRAPVKTRAGMKFSAPAPSRPQSSEVVDDALFLSEKRPSPVKTPANKRMVLGGVVVLGVIIAIVYFIGLPMFTGNPAAETTPTPELTITPSAAPTLTATPAPVSSALVPQSTQQPPTDQPFFFSIQKDPLTAKITVIFAGSASAGKGSIRSAEVKVTHPGGAVATGIIMPLKGVTEITLDGSKETDRLEIMVTMSSGETYRVRDEQVPYLGL